MKKKNFVRFARTIQIADRLDWIRYTVQSDFIRLHGLLNGFSNVAETSINSSLSGSGKKKKKTFIISTFFGTSRIPVSVAALTAASRGP